MGVEDSNHITHGYQYIFMSVKLCFSGKLNLILCYIIKANIDFNVLWVNLQFISPKKKQLIILSTLSQKKKLFCQHVRNLLFTENTVFDK